MESVYILIPLSIILVFLVCLALWWSARNGQFDDLEGPGYRILMDDDTPHENIDRQAREADSDTQKTTAGDQSS